MIYVVEVQDQKFVKIGFTESGELANRIAALQTGCPYEIKPVVFVDGTLRQERSLHAVLRDAFLRIRIPHPPNEWYPGRNPFMQSFLEELALGFAYGFQHCAKYHQNVKQPGKDRDGNSRSISENVKWPKK